MIKIVEYTHIHNTHEQSQNSPIKIKRKKKKENSTELQKPKIEADVCNNNKKRDWEGKKAQRLNWIS